MDGLYHRGTTNFEDNCMSDSQNSSPTVIHVRERQSFSSRLMGGLIGSIIVGIVTGLFRYSVFSWMPVVLAGVLSLFGWETKPPEGVKEGAHNVVKRIEDAIDHTAEKMRESVEAAKAKVELEAKELRATTARERELIAQKLRDMDDKAERRKKELEDKAEQRRKELEAKFEEQKRELALKATEKVVENRVQAAKSGLASMLPSWGSSEQSKDHDARPVWEERPTFNGMCPYCGQPMRVRATGSGDVRCPRCQEIFTSRRARAFAEAAPARRRGF